MTARTAVFDHARSFYRYLPVCRRDRDWGLYVTGTGHEVMDSLARESSAAESDRQTPYRFEWKSSDARDFSIAWDPDYPEPYRFDWDKGRVLSDEFGLLYIDAGSPWLFEAESIAEPAVVQPGSIVLLFPDVWHRYRPLFGEAHHYSSTLWCHFGGETAHRWQATDLFSPKRPILSVGESPLMESAFRRLHNSVQFAESACRQQMLAAVLLELLASAEAAAHSPAAPLLPADAIEQAKVLLEDLVVDGVGPLAVARILNCSYDQFRRSFKMSTGMSPHQYHLRAVIRRAQELLAGTSMSVKEIAAALHFSDQYYFAKIFKRKVAATPTEWRAHGAPEPTLNLAAFAL